MFCFTFRYKEASRVETGSYGGEGVNHAGLINPLEGAFLWMPLNGIKWVTVGCGNAKLLSAFHLKKKEIGLKFTKIKMLVTGMLCHLEVKF